jgi:hypothetical protein
MLFDLEENLVYKKKIYIKSKEKKWELYNSNISFFLNYLSCSLSISLFLLLYFRVWVFDFLVEAEKGSDQFDFFFFFSRYFVDCGRIC